MNNRLILASSSVNRKEILERAGIPFSVLISDADETTHGLSPAQLVQTVACRKAEAVRTRCRDSDVMPAAAVRTRCRDTDVILAADTVVSIDGETLGKPKDAADAKRVLHLLSGRTHTVLTGVCLVCNSRRIVFFEKTHVHFYPLSAAEIERYVKSGEAFGRAGAYGIQGPAALFVARIEGDYNNAVGLPLARTMREMRRFFNE